MQKLWLKAPDAGIVPLPASGAFPKQVHVYEAESIDAMQCVCPGVY
ncbi:MAG: hypothetical protein JW751_15405 [Polyangiaceae bacterium]|nr:hypothetical protein [Polyangiaceae bacterium]